MKNLSEYKTFLEQINQPIIVFNNDLEVKYLNNATKSLFDINNATEINTIYYIVDKKAINQIQKESSLIKNKSNEYEIKYKNKFLNFSSSIISFKDKSTYDLSIIEDKSEIHTSLLLNECIYKISEASHYVDDLMDLYNIIHEIISDIIYTENFYIATADWENNIIHFPYFVDKYDSKPASKSIGNGLTEYVLKSGESILVNPLQSNQFLNSKKIFRNDKMWVV